jgi:hypothetical protein
LKTVPLDAANVCAPAGIVFEASGWVEKLPCHDIVSPTLAASWAGLYSKPTAPPKVMIWVTPNAEVTNKKLEMMGKIQHFFR